MRFDFRINFLAEFKRAYDSSRSHYSAATWRFKEIMSGLTLGAHREQLDQSVNDPNLHGDNMTR